MSWFRVDDMFWEHPKVAEVSDAAAGLWAKAGSYCKYFGTDGHVSKAVIRHLSTSRRVSPLVAELVAANLWEFDDRSGGYVFHDWRAYQTLTDAEFARRSAHARAQQTYRDKALRAARDQSGDHDGDRSRDHDGDRSQSDHRDRPVIDHTSDHSRARVHNPDKTTSVSSSATGTNGRAPDDDDRSPEDDDQDGWAGAGSITPAQAHAAIATATVRECTGLVIPAAEAAAIVADVLGGRQVRDPAGYLRRAIAAEASRDVALIRWLGGPPPPATPASCRPSAGDRAPLARSARDALDHARHPEGHDPGRVSDPEAAHRGADRARQMLAGRPKPAEAEVAPPPPVYTPDDPALDPAALRAAQLAAEAEADPEPPTPPPEPGDDEPELPPEPDHPGDDAEDIPF